MIICDVKLCAIYPAICSYSGVLYMVPESCRSSLLRRALHHHSNLLAAPIQVQLHRYASVQAIARGIAIERERQREAERMQEERGWESLEERNEEGVAAIRLL